MKKEIKERIKTNKELINDYKANTNSLDNENDILQWVLSLEEPDPEPSETLKDITGVDREWEQFEPVYTKGQPVKLWGLKCTYIFDEYINQDSAKVSYTSGYNPRIVKLSDIKPI